MDNDITEEEKRFNDLCSKLYFNLICQKKMMDEFPILKEFCDLQKQQKEMESELEELKSKVVSQIHYRCNHIWIKALYIDSSDRIEWIPRCLKCGHRLSLVDRDDKKQYFTDIKSDYDFAKKAYDEIIGLNPLIDDENAIKLLEEKINSSKQDIVEKDKMIQHRSLSKFIDEDK